MGETDEFEAKQKELEAIANPIIQKAYQAAGDTGDMPDMGGASSGQGGPHIEEVD